VVHFGLWTLALFSCGDVLDQHYAVVNCYSLSSVSLNRTPFRHDLVAFAHRGGFDCHRWQESLN